MHRDILGRWLTQRGLLSLCPTLFKSEKVNGQRFYTVVLFGLVILRVLDINLVPPRPVWKSPRAFYMAASSITFLRF